MEEREVERVHSDTAASMPPMACTASFKWTFSMAYQMSSSVYFSNGSKLLRIVPVKSVGSCHVATPSQVSRAQCHDAPGERCRT
jgi:hypothetical protein